MSKQKVLTVIDKKINIADGETRKLEKDYVKESKDTKNFVKEYLQKRKEFHKYNILKVKVHQS